ncbi:ras-responsive element-binding protein 1 isoform X1 [Neodiprion pinetum]|uniref:Ras-responsive element-binding protein 1 n=1 Tax=Neodiprion lecontei TaxID=441921 RepID=A0A6J0C6Q1_NEOLC|nr:ras-responsive element-binding protein 1 isoform X1 [Neodiprion lecontei]XP_046474274.1 ras-responsive element-binding protein 1 isoform X1 [Neodiprion pinetum]XP_046474275.1 ras-responsive element-binding protein 1 isoform X1 [Neodiprion pinetum]XP_046591299.1 ras-responsive element-binding protein 1 isoform X1 [Neodiprion lecontei]
MTGRFQGSAEELLSRSRHMACLADVIPLSPIVPFLVTVDNGLEQRQNIKTQIDTDTLAPVDQSGSALVCPACSLVLPSTRDLTNHIRGHNSRRNSEGSSVDDEYTCCVCNKVLSSASSLDRHILVHSGERPFKCGICGTTFTTNGNMHRHIRTAHGSSSSNSCTDSDGSCDFDRPELKRRRDAEFNNNNNLSKRKSPDHMEDDLPASKRPHKILLRNKSTTKAKIQTETQPTHSCPLCGRNDFATSSQLKAHFDQAHPDYPMKCDICNLIFQNLQLLNQHRRTAHRSNDDQNVNVGDSVTGFSDLTFMDFSAINFPGIARALCETTLHLPASGEVTKFQCRKCFRAFPCRASLDSHETDCGTQIAVRENIPEDQSKRNDFFAGLNLQDKAALTEAKEGKDLADIQSIISLTSETAILQNFSRPDTITPDNVIRAGSSVGSSGSSCTTSAENNEEELQDAFSAQFRRMKLRGEFPCRLCNAIFPNLRALKGHNRAHMGVNPGMPYPCNMCPYTSTDKATLVKHLRSHNGDRPYECSMCNYAFTTKANCERHLRNRHAKLTREEVKKALIYHPSEDPQNDNGEPPARIVRDDMRTILVYPMVREEAMQEKTMSVGPDVKAEIRVIDEAKLRQPDLGSARQDPQPSSSNQSEIFQGGNPEIQPLEMQVPRHTDISMDIDQPQDLVTRPLRFTHNNRAHDDNSSSGSVSPLVTDANQLAAIHQRLPNPHIGIQTSTGHYSSGNDVPLDLSMDALDLSKKSKVTETKQPAVAPNIEESHRSDNNIYHAANQLLLTQALLKSSHNPQTATLQEALYANAQLLFPNLGTFSPASFITPFMLNPHLFANPEFAMNSRLPKEPIRGLGCSGGSLVEPPISRLEFGTPYSQSSQASYHSTSEDTTANSPKLMSPKLSSKVPAAREKIDNSSSSNSVKMVIKNGVLMPKQKQRRYRTERPFSCEHCTAKFTLRSNMERHVKQQHPQFWSQRQRGGHSTRGRPPTNPPTLLQKFNQPASQPVSQNFPSILPKIDKTSSTQNHGKHPISDQVKYAILAQQLKANKPEENDSEADLVIDEEPREEKASESQAQNSERQPLSLLRGKLEDKNDYNKDKIMKQHVNEFSKDYLVQIRKQHLEELKLDVKLSDASNAEDNSEKDVKDDMDENKLEDQKSVEKIDESAEVEEPEKTGGEDGTVDLASVSKLLDNASQQYQQFQPQDMSDEEEGLVAAASEGTNSGSEEKSDSSNSETVKKKSAYSMAPNRVPCPYCDRVFPWTSSLRRHILTHTGQKPYQCHYCTLLFTTKSNCDRHLFRKHVKSNGRSRAKASRKLSSRQTTARLINNNAFATRNVPERPYKCNECPSSTFSTMGNLKKHVTSKHRGRRAPKSRSVSSMSDVQNSPNGSSKHNDQSEYESHSSSPGETVRNSPISLVEETVQKANTSSSTDTSQSLKSSPESGSTVSSGSSELPFKCHLCDGSFTDRQDCLEHIKHDHKPEYELLLKKGALDMAAETENHPEEQQQQPQQQSEDGEGQRGKFPDYANRKVVCAFCMRRFWSAEDLRRHMRTHTGERPFTCDICRRKFTLKHSMLRHRKKHDSVRSTIYTGASGDEDASQMAINSNSNSNSGIKTQETSAVLNAVSENATPVRFGAHAKLASLPGKLTSIQRYNNHVESTDENDLISNLLGIRDKTIIDRVLQGSPDDAAKILGVKSGPE